MKKKVTLLLLMMTIIIGLVACSGKDNNDYSDDSNEKIEQQEDDISEDDGNGKNDDSEVEESVQESYEHNDYYLWVSTLKKGEQKAPSMLYDEKFSVPITEDMINQIGGFTTSAFNFWSDETYEGRKNSTT